MSVFSAENLRKTYGRGKNMVTALDGGMMTFPAFIPILARENLYGRAGGCLYGVALWRLMRTHYGLWAPEFTAPPQVWEWWPIPALFLGLLFSALALRKDTM